MTRVIVVGGGISGLALALRLQQRRPDLDLLVLERRTRLGGCIDTTVRDGFTVETGPNGFLDNKPTTLDLGRELGLGDSLVAASAASARNRFLFLEGRLRQLPASPSAFLRTDLLSWLGKLEILTERFRPRRRSPTDETIDAFARRRAGREAALLADAFVTGIFGGDARLLSVQAAFPRLAAFERDHGSIMAGMAQARRQRSAAAGRAQLWSFTGGLRVLIDALATRLLRPPVTGVSVRRVRRDGEGWLVEGDGTERWRADAVVLACPAYQQAALLADHDPALAELVGAIPYNRIAVVGLGYRSAELTHPLDGFGYLSPQRTRRDVLGVQWCSSIYPGLRCPPGTVLLRALCGGWHRADVIDWEDDRLIAGVRAELAQSLRLRATPIFHHVARWDRAIPQYHLGHLDRVARIEQQAARHPGLFLAGNAYRGVAMNDCVEQAGAVTDRVLGAFTEMPFFLRPADMLA
jgi:oxygen-dependent protoporphyrinogen oxidase